MPAVGRKRTPKINRRDVPAAAVPKAVADPGKAEIATADIALLAYSIWEAGGCPDGSALEDWLSAERQLRSQG